MFTSWKEFVIGFDDDNDNDDKNSNNNNNSNDGDEVDYEESLFWRMRLVLRQ